jgi:asparagine N-glycosylation enzyme membrane subunit Stt3
MSFESVLVALDSWLAQLAERIGSIREKLPKLSSKWILVFSLVGLAGLAFLLRCLHLFDTNYYYVMNPDSYFFHWVAKGVIAGEPPPSYPGGTDTYTIHSGLAYPLAYISKAVGSVFGLSAADALDLVSKFLPPTLAVISMLVVYWGAAKIYDRRIGLASAFAWASMMFPVAFGVAGFLDRDGLSMLLLMSGAFLFYLSGHWNLKLANRDVGWLVGGFGVLVAEALLYLEWTFVGPVLLLAIIGAYMIATFLLRYLERMETEPNVVRRLTYGMGMVHWPTFALIVGANAIVGGLNSHDAASWFNFAVSVVQSRGETKITEMQGLSLSDLTAFQFFIIPIALGLYVAWKKRAQSGLFFASWFLVLLILAVFARRVMLYAAPAACLLSGVGLVYLWDSAKQGQYHLFKKIGVAVFLFFTLLLAFYSSYYLASVPALAASQEWQDAMTYLREETPEDSVIMSQWSWGYWILDLGQRRPVVDNGYYCYDSERLRDVALAYFTSDPAEAAQLMKKYGADYLVFSKLDLKYAVGIMSWGNVGEGLVSFPGDSLFNRSLNGEFQSGGGLQVVYRSAFTGEDGSEPEVVILGLTDA